MVVLSAFITLATSSPVCAMPDDLVVPNSVMLWLFAMYSKTTHPPCRRGAVIKVPLPDALGVN
ncbi:MAG: hypothetical protein M2R45_00642 [Verrucomicrobia subdivision 3 bacterium]|nr:hypothetical protein [Limisphaerales bacterium]MCS1414475.1 hypothetical protein [Limisphaerales bacterium]